jgi:hypothetical protein
VTAAECREAGDFVIIAAMRGWRGLIAAVAVGVVLASPAAAQQHDSGGSTIASAPELPLGHQVYGGATTDAHGNYVEYWAVTSVNGDVLDLTVSSTSSAGVTVCLYTPAVTDATLADADCHQTALIAGQGLQTFRFDLSSPGRWILAFRGALLSQPFRYAATGRVEHQQPSKVATTTTLRVKGRARRGTSVRMIGSVTAGATGQVKLQIRPFSTTRWSTITALPLTANSQFSTTRRFARLGRYALRAAYSGDATHFPSSATVTIRVIP